MIRVFIFLAILLALALGIAWIADRPGEVVVTWLGQRVEVDILTAIAAVLAFSLLLMLAWTLIRTIFRIPGLIGLAGRQRRRAKGYEAVSRGLVAIGSGDVRGAERYAKDARRLLGAQPMALVLDSQAAQLAGDATRAETAFTGMLDREDTRVLGLRGLHVEAERKGDRRAARLYAEEAYKIAPGVAWVGDAMLTYRCQDRDWLGAVAAVEQNAARRLIDKEEARRLRAVLLTADAISRADSEPDAALRSAQEALKADATLVPAAAYVGKRLSGKGDYGKAAKVLETAFKALPHPDLSAAYLDVRIGDSSHDRLKRARVLQRLAPASAEGRLAVAEAAIAAGEFQTARENLEALMLDKPSVRACLLMAELEEAHSGNIGLAREWLGRASRAPLDPAWVADDIVSSQWLPVSPVTGKPGVFEWKAPPQAPQKLLMGELARAPEPLPVPTAAGQVAPETAVSEVRGH
jgi:HemY protein